MKHIDLSSEQAVIDWWLQSGPIEEARAPARAIAKAMRLKEVWEQHQFRIKDMVEERGTYRRCNSQTVARAVRAFCYAMERAGEEGP